MNIISQNVNSDSDIRYWVSYVFESTEDRNAFIAKFPKWVGVYATTSQGFEDPTVRPAAAFEIWLKPDAVNGGANETGLKKIARFKTIAAELGVVA